MLANCFTVNIYISLQFSIVLIGEKQLKIVPFKQIVATHKLETLQKEG